MPSLEGIEQSTRTIGKSAGRHVTAEEVFVDTNCLRSRLRITQFLQLRERSGGDEEQRSLMRYGVVINPDVLQTTSRLQGMRKGAELERRNVIRASAGDSVKILTCSEDRIEVAARP